MARLRVKFTYPAGLVTEPVVYMLATQYHLMTNIRRADVQQDRGWVILELEGEEADLEHGLDAVQRMGVRVDPVEGDLIAG
jgi:L-aspartate semialdehyde sulfurtransferase ferredoxin